MRALLLAAAQIKVFTPDYLVSQLKQNPVQGTTATFGSPFYGERLLGQLAYAPSKNEAKGPHCFAEDYDLAPSGRPDEEDAPIGGQGNPLRIVVVKRGICTFVTKVRVAEQDKDAHAVIIVDRDDSQYVSQGEPNIKNLIVADDGYGNQVHIPSILIAKEEGKHIINAVEKGSPVIVELAWDVPTDQIVTLDIWWSAATEELRTFIKNFTPIRKSLGWNVAFTPHYYIFQLPADYNDLCKEKSGEYCADDPDGPGPITGRDVVFESVRQLCILEQTLVTDPGGASPALYSVRFWEYLTAFQERCPVAKSAELAPAKRFGAECAEKVMKSLGLPKDKIDTCMLMTGDQKLSEQRSQRAWSPRAVRINGWRYSGSIEADTVTRAMCAGFREQPHECQKLTERSRLADVEEGGLSFFTFLLIIAAILGAAFLLLMGYRRVLAAYVRSSIREEVMLEVKHQMTDYAQLPNA